MFPQDAMCKNNSFNLLIDNTAEESFTICVDVRIQLNDVNSRLHMRFEPCKSSVGLVMFPSPYPHDRERFPQLSHLICFVFSFGLGEYLFDFGCSVAGLAVSQSAKSHLSL